MNESLNDSLRELNHISFNSKKFGFENILKSPSLIEESKLSEAMLIAEEIYAKINFKNLRNERIIK